MSYKHTFTLRALKNQTDNKQAAAFRKREPMLGAQPATRPGSALPPRDEIPGGAQRDPANLQSQILRWWGLGSQGTSLRGCSAVSAACAEHSPGCSSLTINAKMLLAGGYSAS